MFRASSFSFVFMARFSACSRRGLKSFFFTASVRRSVSAGSLSIASEKRFSVASSVVTMSSASSGQASLHLGSPPQKSQAMTTPVSGCSTIPPCGQAWMHQSQPLHCFSLTIRMPVFSAWISAFSGQALTHGASSQNLHARAKLNMGIMRMVRMRERSGFELVSFFSSVQAYSHMPHPVHLLGSTEMNFLSANFCCVMVPLASWF